MEKVLTQLIQNPEGRKSEYLKFALTLRVRFCLHRTMTTHLIAYTPFLHDITLYPMRYIIDTDSQSGSFAVGEIVGATDLPQPKVNKCLIALVGRKAVGKSMVGVSDGLSLFSLE